VSERERIEAFNPAELVQFVEPLQQRVADLERQNAELRAEVERLKRRQHRQAAPFSEALTLWQSYHAGTATDFAAQAANLHQRLGGHLRERVLPDPDNQRGNLLRFLDDPRIEPTNNRAERVLRPPVIARKVSQCSKARGGAEAFAAFASVLRTTIQQGGCGTDRLAELRRFPPGTGR
jgi:hypothetical protein